MANDRIVGVLLGASFALGIGCSERPASPLDAGGQPLPPVVAQPPRAQPAPQPQPKKVSVKVWFLDDERMKTGIEPLFVPVERQVPEQGAMRAAVEALFAGPTEAEKARGLRLVSSQATGFAELKVEAGIASVRLAGGCSSNGSTATIANELMPTVKQFPEVRAVKIYDPAGKTEEPEKQVDSIPECLEP